jgi:hypothetical protein
MGTDTTSDSAAPQPSPGVAAAAKGIQAVENIATRPPLRGRVASTPYAKGIEKKKPKDPTVLETPVEPPPPVPTKDTSFARRLDEVRKRVPSDPEDARLRLLKMSKEIMQQARGEPTVENCLRRVNTTIPRDLDGSVKLIRECYNKLNSNP